MVKLLLYMMAAAFGLIAATGMVSCNDPAGPSQSSGNDSTLTVIKPASGDIIQAGSAVTVEWRYPKNWPYLKTVIDASISATGIPTWKTITTDTTIAYPQNTFRWIVPSGKTGDSCRVKVYDYDKNKSAYSGYFKVTE